MSGTATMIRSEEKTKAGSGNGSKLVVFGSVSFDCNVRSVRLGGTEKDANTNHRKDNPDFVLLKCWGVLSNGNGDRPVVISPWNQKQQNDEPKIPSINTKVMSTHQNFSVGRDHWVALFRAIRESNADFIPEALKTRLSVY